MSSSAVSSSVFSSSDVSSSAVSSSPVSSSVFSSSPVSSSAVSSSLVSSSEVSSSAVSSSAVSSSAESSSVESSSPLSSSVDSSSAYLSSSSSTSAAAFSDPRFRGFWGQSFYVEGVVGGVYSLITSQAVQVNARFVYLRAISCPQVDGHDVGNCFQEQGTYFGSLAVRVQGGDWLRVVGGGVDTGFASVTVNDRQAVHTGDTYNISQAGAAESPSTLSRASLQLQRLRRMMRGQPQQATAQQLQRVGAAAAQATTAQHQAPTLSVSRASARQLRVQAGDYTFQIDNMDGYVDITQLDVKCWLCLEQGSMQLDGLLGQTWNASAVIKQSDDEVEEYRVQGDELLGCKHAHDRFCQQA